jgi:hypothetical protein
MAINELNKPMGSWCKHCARTKGCTIYDSRPQECRDFYCGWLVEEKFGPEWKPDQSRIVITPGRDGNSMEFRCDPGFPTAWRRDPYYAQIQQFAMDARAYDGRVIVCVGKRMTLIAPEGEFPLGEVSDDDRIICEFSGDRMVRASIQKKNDAGRP